jgi:hypothetical protein
MSSLQNQFTKNLQVGDFITAYHKGIHRVTEIKRRFRGPGDVGKQLHPDGREVQDGEEYNAYVSYEAVLDSSFKPTAKRRKGCDSGFCTKITPDFIKKQRQEFNRQMRALKSLITVP